MGWLFGTVLPFIGFTDLYDDEKEQLGLDLHREYTAFALAWFGRAYIPVVWERK